MLKTGAIHCSLFHLFTLTDSPIIIPITLDYTQKMQGYVSPSFCKLFSTALTNYPDVKEGPLDALKDALLQSKTLHQASIKACTFLCRLIVFPTSAELRGIQNHLIQESNYCERGVLLWIAQVELLSAVEGCLDCQRGLLLNCQNSHRAGVEASSCGRYIHIFQMLNTHIHRLSWGPMSAKRQNPLFHSNWTLYLVYVLEKHTQQHLFQDSPAAAYSIPIL